MLKAGSKLNDANVYKLLITECGQNFNEFDRDFPFNFLGYLSTVHLQPTSVNFGKSKRPWFEYVEFEKSEINEVHQDLFDFLVAHRFTLRHYSNIKPNIIRSKFATWVNGSDVTRLSSNDWLTVGATAFTDWMFCIDGRCPIEDKPNSLDNFIKFYDEFEIDFIDIFLKGLGDTEFIATKQLNLEIENISHGVKIDLVKGKLVFLPEILFGYLTKRKGVSKTWLAMMEGKEQAKTLLDTIEEKLPMLNIMIPGSVSHTSWIVNDRVVKRHFLKYKETTSS